MRHSREDSAFSESMSSPQRDTEAAARPPSPAKLTGKAGPLVAPSATDPLSRCCTLRFGSTTKILAKRMFQVLQKFTVCCHFPCPADRMMQIHRSQHHCASDHERLLSGYHNVLRVHQRWHTSIWHAQSAVVSSCIRAISCKAACVRGHAGLDRFGFLCHHISPCASCSQAFVYPGLGSCGADLCSPRVLCWPQISDLDARVRGHDCCLKIIRPGSAPPIDGW